MLNSQTAQYKIVFCDIDGTLIDSSYQIPNGTKQKLQELCRAGIRFIPISARMPSGILPLLRELSIKAPIVCYSGALILDEQGQCLHSAGMERETALRVEHLIKNGWPQVCCGAFRGDDWLVDDPQNPWVAQEQSITSSVPTQRTLSEAIPPGGQVHKFLCMGEPSQIAGLDQTLKEQFPSLSVHRSKDTYLEIMDGLATKAGALLALCSRYGIPAEATAAFGDGFNDVDMLLTAGAGFAMGNAPDEVKHQARFVTLDNDHEGVLAGLNQLNFANNACNS